MQRLVLSGALLVGACGVTDDRPANLEYITNAILAPTCAMAQCHSAFKRAEGDQFDTVEAARLSIVGNVLVDPLGGPLDPTQTFLIQSVTVGTRNREGETIRMPYDAPMPDADVQLIIQWIRDGAKGAQCIANAEGNGCARSADGKTRVVKCVDGTIGDTVQDCTGNQLCSFNVGNGKCSG
jgi:hypothetical protein